MASHDEWESYIDAGLDIPAHLVRCRDCPLVRTDVVQPPCRHASRQQRALDLSESMRLTKWVSANEKRNAS